MTILLAFVILKIKILIKKKYAKDHFFSLLSDFAVCSIVNWHEVKVMIVRIVIRVKLIWARWVFSAVIANCVCFHVLWKENLVRRMSVFQPLERHVWHQVLVMDHSPDCVQFCLHELRQVGISHSWLPKVVHLHFVFRSVFELNLKTSNHWECSSKTVTWTDDFFDFVFCSKLVNVGKDSGLHSDKIEVKSSMNGTVFALGVWTHFEVEIFPPISFVFWPSNCKYYSFDIRPVSDVSSSKSEVVKDIKRILDWDLLRDVTVPGFYALLVAER